MKTDNLLGLGMSGEQRFNNKQQRIELTGREYDKTVKRYEETGETKYLRILQNCTILMGAKRAKK